MKLSGKKYKTSFQDIWMISTNYGSPEQVTVIIQRNTKCVQQFFLWQVKESKH